MIITALDVFSLSAKLTYAPAWVCDASSSDFICMASLESVLCNKFGQIETEEKIH